MMMLGCWRLEARERSEWSVVREALEGQRGQQPSKGALMLDEVDEDDEDDDVDGVRI